jgi:signal transduction histidine kinase
VAERRRLDQFEPVRQALSQGYPLRQMEFEDQGKKYLGVYQKTAVGGAIVVAMTAKDSALSARGLLLERTLYVSLVIVTVVFIVSLFFSASLSDPLLRLVRITQEVAGGKFDVRIPIDTGDEIGTLARSVQDMASKLETSRAELEVANFDLEQKVLERTRELESRNVDIRKQQEVLLRATRLAAVGEIAGQAAHEVLNPLTAMTSRLESLDQKIREFTEETSAPIPSLKTILDAWQKDYEREGFDGWLRAVRGPSQVLPEKTLFDEDLYNLAIIWAQLFHHHTTLRDDLALLLSESHRIARIVDGMRGLSRTRQIRARADVTELVHESVRVSEDLLKRHHIAIETEFDERPLFAILDKDEMRQVFSNLIKNSMDAIESLREQRPGPVREGLVRIHVARVTGERDLIRISLRDNGLGIPEADRNRVFDADFSTKGAEGTGFGLSICRRFVRQAGGELVVSDSRPGEFTEFEITLPVAEESAPQEPKREPA